MVVTFNGRLLSALSLPAHTELSVPGRESRTGGLMFQMRPIAAAVSRLRPLEANMLEHSLREQRPPATPHVQCALSDLSSQDLQSVPSMGRSKLSSGFRGERRVEVLLPRDCHASKHLDSKQVNQSTGRVDAESKKCCKEIKQKR